jgi:PAS domain S-box-containing protein
MATRRDGTISYMNEAAEALWGWKAEDVVGHHVDGFPTADGADELLDQMRAHAAAGEPYDCEIPTVRTDGSVIPCHFMMRPVRSANGELLGRIIVFRDLTDERSRDTKAHLQDLRASAIAVLGARALAKGGDSASSDEVLLRDTVEATRRLLDADRAGYLEVNEDGSLSTRTSDTDVLIPMLPGGTGSLAGFTVLARTAIVVDDIALERRFNVDAFPPGTRSAIAAPVFGALGVRGVLSAGRGPADSFDDAAADFVQAMANVIGAALK